MPYRIVVFSWNTESINLSESLSSEVIDYNRSSYSDYIPSITSWRYQCNIPDFYPKFVEFIKSQDPDIIVIGFQEDRYPGSYFHSHLLPIEMPKLDYELVKRTKLMGLGITTYKGLFKGDLFSRGVRVSIYAKKNLLPLIEKEEGQMRLDISNEGQTEYICSSYFIRSKGATASYLILPDIGRLVFICCHLPFNARSIINERFYNNRMLRQNELNYSNICFNNIIENLVLFNDPIPTHVIFFGDFNYRVADPHSAEEVANEFQLHRSDFNFIYDMYNKYDELKEQMRRENIYEFLEGIDNHGPAFIPTSKLVKGRKDLDDSEYWKTGKQQQRVPSWCDRILYNKFGKDDGHNLMCTYYDRFDVGEVMAKSDHAGVIGVFDLI